MKPIVRQQIQEIIEENPDAAQATAKILDFMDREFDASGNGWFEDDPNIFVFFDRYCSDEDRHIFEDLPLNTELIYKGERMVKTGKLAARRVVKGIETLTQIDVEINPPVRVYEVGPYD